jgi:hypothetical protein
MLHHTWLDILINWVLCTKQLASELKKVKERE